MTASRSSLALLAVPPPPGIRPSPLAIIREFTASSLSGLQRLAADHADTLERTLAIFKDNLQEILRRHDQTIREELHEARATADRERKARLALELQLRELGQRHHALLPAASPPPRRSAFFAVSKVSPPLFESGRRTADHTGPVMRFRGCAKTFVAATQKDVDQGRGGFYHQVEWQPTVLRGPMTTHRDYITACDHEGDFAEFVVCQETDPQTGVLTVGDLVLRSPRDDDPPETRVTVARWHPTVESYRTLVKDVPALLSEAYARAGLVRGPRRLEQYRQAQARPQKKHRREETDEQGEASQANRRRVK